MGSRLCDMLGIKYPIIEGVAGGNHIPLATAVSQAGGLGTLHGAASAIGLGLKEMEGTVPMVELTEKVSKEQTSEQRKATIKKVLQEVRSRTDKPFSLNIPITIFPRNIIEDLVATAIEDKMKVVTVSAGSPKLYTQRLKDGGVKVMHIVSNTAHAVKAMEAGVDAVIVSGIEAGGWQSFEEITTLTLVPQVVDAVQGKIPVIACGGIGDARGVVAAFSLGAEGVQMGTRFVASVEAETEEKMQQAILKARDNSTEVIGRGERPARGFTVEYLAEVWPGFVRPPLGPSGGGQVCGLIHEILTVKEIIEQIAKGVGEIESQMKDRLSPFIG